MPYIRQIVETKYIFNRSIFYSYNYKEIKDFLKRVNKNRWIMMLKWEMRKIWMCRIQQNKHTTGKTEEQVINNINERMRRMYFS